MSRKSSSNERRSLSRKKKSRASCYFANWLRGANAQVSVSSLS